MMEVTAKLRGAAISAQKARLVADLIRGKSVAHALNILNFSNKKSCCFSKHWNLRLQTLNTITV